MSEDQYREMGNKLSAAKKGMRPVYLEGFKKGHKGFRTPESYKNMGGWKWSEIAKEQFSMKRKGSNGNNWKGGITPLKQRMRLSFEWREWRKKVFERDDYTCRECGITNQKGLGKSAILHPHHIRPCAKYPELTYEISNGITLCKSCHKKVTWQEEKWIEYFEHKIIELSKNSMTVINNGQLTCTNDA